MRHDPVAVTLGDTSLTSGDVTGDVMNKHDIDWLPVVENKGDRRLVGIVRSEKMLPWLVERSPVDPSGP